MTIFELGFFIMNLAIGSAIAAQLHPIGGYWISIPGFIGGVSLLPVFFTYVYPAWRRFAYCGDKPDPDCKCGNADYALDMKDMILYKTCRHCGRVFIKRYPRVWMIENGEVKPYRRLTLFKGWHAFEVPKEPRGWRITT